MFLCGGSAPVPPILVALCQRRVLMDLDSSIAGRVGEKDFFFRIGAILFGTSRAFPARTRVTFCSCKK